MADIDRCQACGADIEADSSSQDAEFCPACLRERIETLEDTLAKVGKLCLHTPGSPIWMEVDKAIGASGEKRWT